MELIYPTYEVPLLPRPNVKHPSEPIPPGTEMLPAVDENGVVIGRMTREYAHGGDCVMHPVVHLHILRRDERLYLQKRSMTKKLLPGYWDTAVGGHVSYGEMIGDALCREAYEELRLSRFNPIPMLTYQYDGNGEKELVSVFACVGGDFELTPDDEEVSEGRWWTEKEIEDNFGKSVLTPNFEQEYVRIRKALMALL